MKGHKMKTKKKKFGFTPTPICVVGEKEECVRKQIGRQISKSPASCKLVRGFTIVELLTVMAVIALLIGILMPALSMVRRISKDTRQKAQFHAIGIALETYAGEMEQYPDSKVRPWDPINNEPYNPPFTVGAHHLAEALLGRDMLGFDPWTTLDAKVDETNKDIYASKSPPKGSLDDQITKSLDRRKGPYLNPGSVEAYQIAQLYTDTAPGPGDVYPGNLDKTGVPSATYSPAPVLTDSYRVKTVSLPGGNQVKAGTPILYYRADVTSRVFENSKNGDGTAQTVSDACAVAGIYDSFDNEALLKLGTIMDQNKKHNFDADEGGSLFGRTRFYDAITNPTITTQRRPYNQDSYILISAGFDGIFGTPDDIYNFTQ
jgi:prepilin-type N-terminal cleavage/methylation domain-containing protein